MSEPFVIYIRKHSQIIKKGNIVKSTLTLQARGGVNGSWDIAGDENGPYDFPDEAARDEKIAQLVAAGAVLV